MRPIIVAKCRALIFSTPRSRDDNEIMCRGP